MATRLGLIFSILAFQALSFPAGSPRTPSPETWSLMGFRRACSEDQAECTYSFLISEDPAIAPKYCNFTIDAAGGLPAYQTDFSALECPGSPEYTVNGGWDEQKFVTLTVINQQRGLLSFFSARDSDLWAGNEVNPQTSNVFNHPMATKRDAMPRGVGSDWKKRRKGGGQKKLEEARERDGGVAYASEWKLVDVIRYEFLTGPFTDRLVIMVGVRSGNSTIESCHITIRPFEGLKPPGKSFAHQNCKDGGWSASWRHNETTATYCL
ncbi:uncharacterized protein LY79DRAFT_150749 [Colletotrichum navitas]|uniref:Uncharacterized protein n=1 Tax=Colletotrichum navitas TaxID=681940 RepID=A0AAD8V9W7_9PEZI|nr:uncharacterized protein LY79DRAFT_150749 [Colletotrichum navitas]KAK1599762.1 hypothetical protein LY79DRAFT_150749 [Colletotrichum navitas]